MSAKIYNGIITKTSGRAVPIAFAFQCQAFLLSFSIKSKKSLDDPYVFSLSLGNGIALEGEYLVFTLTGQMTRGIRHPKLYADAKSQATGSPGASTNSPSPPKYYRSQH